MNTYLSTTAIITSIPSIESNTKVVIVDVIIFFIIMIAVTVVLILVTSIWFGTLLCLDATFTSTATGLSTKEANSTQIIAKETQSEESKKSCLMFRGKKSCLGFSLPQTPLMWEPPALGLPFLYQRKKDKMTNPF